jgi:hypothetical protein
MRKISNYKYKTKKKDKEVKGNRGIGKIWK